MWGECINWFKKIDEVFIIDLNRLDCFTYVEYVHALANSNNYLEFKNKVREYRYYKGEVNFITEIIFLLIGLIFLDSAVGGQI